jgi:hypothetical protein
MISLEGRGFVRVCYQLKLQGSLTLLGLNFEGLIAPTFLYFFGVIPGVTFHQCLDS